MLRAERPNLSQNASRRRAHKFNKKHRGTRFTEKGYAFFLRKRNEKAVLMVLPFRQSFVSLALLPETSSRVTLALLGSVFQTKKDRNISYKIGQDLIIVLVYSSHCRGEGHLTTLYYIAKFLKRRMHSPSHYEL